MNENLSTDLKAEVRAFWNQAACDTPVASGEKFSKDYFEQIEDWRYNDQPFIHSFAQFSRYHGKKVLEVGFGAGTDLIQWLRSGANVSGVDLTEEALNHAQRRIDLYQLPQPESLQVADAEALPFPDNQFDLGYSFGVLHHSPDTVKAVAELARVIRPGGEMKIMLYNRYSAFAFNLWLKFAALKGRPWRSFGWVLWRHMESLGTKAYTRPEICRMLAQSGMSSIRINTHATTSGPVTQSSLAPFLNPIYRTAVALSHERLGFFHCVTARKNT